MPTVVKNLLTFTALPPAGSVVIPHELFYYGYPRRPDYIAFSVADVSFVVADETNITIINNGVTPASGQCYVEAFHTFERDVLPIDPFLVAPFASLGGNGGTAGGSAGGQLSGTYPNPSVVGLTESSGPTALTIAGVANGQVLTRSGATIIGTTPLALTGSAPVDVQKNTAQVGVGTTAARDDHRHDILTATAVELTDSTNAEGSGQALARAAHTHAHGTRGGGSLHATAVANVSAGFISAANQTKLDNTGVLSGTAPVNVTRVAASAGVAVDASRSDHKHDVATAIAVTLTDATNAEGSAISMARSDHLHAHGTRGGGNLHALAIAGGAAGFLSGTDKQRLDNTGALASVAPVNVTKAAASAGVAVDASRGDHKHDVTTAIAVELTDATNAEGASSALARADHSHAHGVRSGGTLHAVAVAGVSNGFISSDDQTKLDNVGALASIAPVDVQKNTAQVGVGTTAARDDHRHDILTATAVELTDSTNAEGSGQALARAAHTHAHGVRSGGTLHAVAVAGVSNGFVSSGDQTKLDALTVPIPNSNLATMAANTVKANATGGTAAPTDFAIGANSVLGRAGGNLVAAQLLGAQVAANTLVNSKLAQPPANTVRVNDTAGAADIVDLAVSTNTVVGRQGANIVAAQIIAAQVTNNTLTNAKLAQPPANTVRVNDTAGAADIADLAMGASTILARLAAGNIVAATVSEINTLLGTATAPVPNSQLATMAGNTIKANNAAGVSTPSDVAVGTNTVVGRVTGNLVAASLVGSQVAANTLDNSKLAQPPANTVRVNNTAGATDIVDLAMGGNTVLGRVGAGNIVAAQLVDAQITANTITNAKLAQPAGNTVRVNNAAAAGNIVDLTMGPSTILARLAAGNVVAATPTQINTLLDVVTITGTQTVTGAKTFEDITVGTGGASLLKTTVSLLTVQRAAAGKSQLAIISNPATSQDADLFLQRGIDLNASVQWSIKPTSLQAIFGTSIGSYILNAGVANRNVDTIIRGNTDNNLVTVDAGTDTVGIGKAPIGSAILDIEAVVSDDNIRIAKSNSTTGWLINAGRSAFFDNWLLFKNTAEAGFFTLALVQDGRLLSNGQGSAGSATYSWLGFTNYGMFVDDALAVNYVGLSAGGTLGLKLDANGQIATGIFPSTLIDASAQLQVNSTTRGFLPPRMTAAQRIAIASPAAGLIVHDTTTDVPWYYDGTAWQPLQPIFLGVAGTSGAPQSQNLPASPSDGELRSYRDTDGNASANNITFNGNGNNINGVASVVMTADYGAITFRYNGTEWEIR